MAEQHLHSHQSSPQNMRLAFHLIIKAENMFNYFKRSKLASSAKFMQTI